MKEVIGILGIALPAFIIILCIVRIFMKKTRGVNGLILFFAILLLLLGIIRYLFYQGSTNNSGNAKTPPLAVSSHSVAFNRSVENILAPYYQMTDAFANSDTGKINQTAKTLQAALDSLQLDELKVDSLIYQTALQPFTNLQSEIGSIIADPSLAEKRGSLNIFSNELQALLSIIRYDLAKLYWQECADAFGEDKPGNWLSRAEKSTNPYGKPGCGEIKSTINFVPADTTKKQ